MGSFYRRLIFWLFFLLFVLTTPLAVLYSQGYRFDQYRKIFIHSGSITIKSTPSSVNIYLNGELQPSGSLDIINNSITINGLRPGNYDLRVSADGYGEWEKNVEVHSGISTEFWNVYLAPQNPAIAELNTEGAQRFFPSPFGKKIAYYKNNGDQSEVWSLNIKNNEPSLIFSKADLKFSDDPLENAEWNFKEKLIIVPVFSDDRKDFLILDSEKNVEPIFLSQITQLIKLDRARWSPDSEKTIYFTARSEINSQKNLYRINLDTKETELVVENIKGYDLASNSIYFLKQNNILCKTNLDGKNENQLTLSQIAFSNESEKPRIIAYDDSRQAIVSEEGELFVHNNGESDFLKKIASDVVSVQFSDDGKKLLYWNDNEINVLYLREWKVQPRRAENEIQQIIRFSLPIKNVFWYRDYEHIFFSIQNKVKIIELDSRDHRVCLDILKYNSDDFSSSYDSANGIYYYLDEINGTKKIFYLYVPEQTSFFGG